MHTPRIFKLSALCAAICSSAYADAQNNNQNTAQSDESIETIFVVGSKPERYRATDASSATAFDTDIKDIPRSIQVVTEQIILDQQATDLEDVVKNVSGVQTISNFGNTTDSFMIRGFNVRQIFQDGFRLSNNITRVQTSNIERVEFLKGASALLYGQVQPGGLINVVTKKPQGTTRNFISTSFDEHGKQYLLADFTGAANQEGSVLYRFVGSVENSDTFREAASEAELKRTNISPSITWHISDSDTLTAGFEYIDAELPVDRGTVLVVDGNGQRSIADIPRARRLNEDDAKSDTEQYVIRVDYQHEFSNDLVLDAKFRHQDGEADTRDSSILSFGIPTTTLTATPLPPVSNILAVALQGFDPGINFAGVPENGQLMRTGFNVQSEEENTYFSIRITGEQGMHKFAVGADYNTRDSEFRNFIDTLPAELTGLPLPLPPGTQFLNFSPIDIFNPTYGTQLSNSTETRTSTRDDIAKGIYMQDLISLSEQWKLLIGLRWDSFERDETTNNLLIEFPDPALATVARLPANIASANSTGSESELSPNIGVVYQPSENISWFASYSESFNPNYTTNVLTSQLISVAPREGQQFEVGIKGSFWNDLLSFNAAYFDLTHNNAINGSDPQTGNPIVNGEEQAKGVEVDATVQFADGLNLIFNYAHIEAEITQSRRNQGNTPLGVPDNSGNLWLTYEMTGGDLKGLGFGGGLNYVSDRYIDAANSFELDGYVTADITAWYFWQLSDETQLKVQAGVKNLTDKKYYEAAQGSPFDINVEQPRTIYASFTLEF